MSSSTQHLTPAAMAERTGVSLDTLRYHEREGLIDPVARGERAHRRYRYRAEVETQIDTRRDALHMIDDTLSLYRTEPR